ncbi:MAG TPA: cobalt-precorrin-6A reductase [Kamptonema sp.]|nr:cobalt-precorrin-6A reductase [Kamptonema sp.]
MRKGDPNYNNRRIWLVGGTSESAQIARVLAQCELPCTISVTTETAKNLYPAIPTLRVWVGNLDDIELGEFLQEQQIVAILDASHPYAVSISHLAISAAERWQIPYLRYERLSLQSSKSAKVPIIEDKLVIELANWESLLAGNYLTGKRVLLTVGYRPLLLFRSWQTKSTLFARILPAARSLAAAIEAGFSGDRLIAIRPPISAELETALWQQWQISLVITKASGTPGGEDIKREVAAKLGIPLIVIDRPVLDYPQQTSDLARAVEFCQQHLAESNLQ